jgi:hypothetical protein
MRLASQPQITHAFALGLSSASKDSIKAYSYCLALGACICLTAYQIWRFAIAEMLRPSLCSSLARVAFALIFSVQSMKEKAALVFSNVMLVEKGPLLTSMSIISATAFCGSDVTDQKQKYVLSANHHKGAKAPLSRWAKE